MTTTFKPQCINVEHVLRVYDSMYLFDKLRSCVDHYGNHIQHYFYEGMLVFGYIFEQNSCRMKTPTGYYDWFACFPLRLTEDNKQWILMDNAYIVFPKGSDSLELLVPDNSLGHEKKITAERLREFFDQRCMSGVPTLCFKYDGVHFIQPHVASEVTGESIPKVIHMYNFGTDLVDELSVELNPTVRSFGRYIYCLREKEATFDAIEAYKEIDIEKIMSLNRDHILDVCIESLFDLCRSDAKRLWKLNCGISMEHRNTVDTFDGSVVSRITNSVMNYVTQQFFAIKNTGKLK